MDLGTRVLTFQQSDGISHSRQWVAQFVREHREELIALLHRATQGFFKLLPLGNIHDNGDAIERLARLIALQGDGDVNPDDRPILSYVSLFAGVGVNLTVMKRTNNFHVGCAIIRMRDRLNASLQ